MLNEIITVYAITDDLLFAQRLEKKAMPTAGYSASLIMKIVLYR